MRINQRWLNIGTRVLLLLLILYAWNLQQKAGLPFYNFLLWLFGLLGEIVRLGQNLLHLLVTPRQ
jgi:hypothetical protein